MTKRSASDIIIHADFGSINGGIAQLARAFGSYPKCRRFKSYFRYLTAVTRVRFPSGSPEKGCRKTAFSDSQICRRGGIGRHKGLKIPRNKPRTGSSPVAGTKNSSFSTAVFLLPTLLKMLENGLNTEVLSLLTIKLDFPESATISLKCYQFCCQIYRFYRKNHDDKYKKCCQIGF